MTNYWIGVVSKQHVERGKSGGFAQVCHGKVVPLRRMRGGDLLIYYSPQLIFGEKDPYQCFTALGVISEKQPYQFEMSPDFIPFRRDVSYFNLKDVPIRPLISSLNFIKDKQRWGGVFRYGILKIEAEDFITIVRAMQLEEDKINELLI